MKSYLLLLSVFLACKSEMDDRKPVVKADIYSWGSVVESLKGKWRYEGPKTAECPDILWFDQKDNSYYVINHCAGEGQYSMIEKGHCAYSEKDRTLKFYNRKFRTKYFFQNDSSELTIYIKELRPLEMKICFNGRVGCSEQIFAKINP